MKLLNYFIIPLIVLIERVFELSFYESGSNS